jgi:hypothetical protein
MGSLINGVQQGGAHTSDCLAAVHARSGKYLRLWPRGKKKKGQSTMKNIFKEEELQAATVTEDFSVTATDGKNYKVKHYNLDAVIAVGYRVNTKRATAFRRWATGILRDYALRGYVLDRKRMENGTFLDDDYFERLLEEIREIRLSERRFYQKITDIYATSMDYNKNAPITREFFAKVQNKMHFAAHGHTA